MTTLMIWTQTGNIVNPLNTKASLQTLFFYYFNTPGGTRTPNLGVRSALLYPVELLEQKQCENIISQHQGNTVHGLRKPPR